MTESRDINGKVTKSRDFKRKSIDQKVEISIGKCSKSRDFNRKAKRKLQRCPRGKCIQRSANRIVMVVGVVGLRRCALEKCIQRVANRTVMVSRWLWVVGLRNCARGKCTHRVANRIVMVVSRWVCGAVLGGNAFRELQIALSELQIALESERN